MTDGRLNILVLHALGDMTAARRTSVNHAKFLAHHAPEHNYLFHDYSWPVTPSLLAIRFHVVLLDTTFLCMRYSRPRSIFEAIRGKYSFVSKSDAVKIAFPQDEYDHGEILDEWLESYGTDAVYSVVWNGWDLFFPRTSKKAEILQALTGYVSDEDVKNVSRFARPYRDRVIDVGYRARDLPAQFGSHGQLKARLGDRFVRAASGDGLRLDVSTRPEDVLLGDAWVRFLGDSKHTLGCEGGSSLWDPRGEIRDRVFEYVAEHPRSTFEEVEAACFPGLDRQRVFSAISPRLFEVTAARSDQVLVPAPYLGQLRPGEHYVPLAEDFSNIQEVLAALGDDAAAERRIEACWAALIEPDTYRYGRHAANVMAKIQELVARKGLKPGSEGFAEHARAHQDVIRSFAKAESRRQRISVVRERVRLAIPKPIRLVLRRLLRRN